MEQKAKTPEGDSGSLRPPQQSEEAQAPPLGKRSHLRKGTALRKHKLKFFLHKLDGFFETYSL
ncbi:hypothetical protein FZC76_17005 [Sutcliffiella horikoshii]|uniref:Uncharacterized protein n=1 Tax=Sutcliffiella horikoshii TaxID=79883 RepID=A0A5D4SUS6_9BACI|nr:hypothetical protein FZC76_17005 [Sutcliffiella horikoshii]